ncbi:MAG: hypothetical protein ACFFD1_08185 [Candidatus Thorarchaeota archaeon]
MNETIIMSKIDPVDIAYSTISGTVSIDNKLYDCSQILQSLSIQGFPIKKYGSSLKIGNQVISPIPANSHIPISSPEAQNIIQSQFRQLFEEINRLKEKINTYSNNSDQMNDAFPSGIQNEQLTDALSEDTIDSKEKDWDNIIEVKNENSGQQSSKVQPIFDVGENNLQRKWTNQYGDNPLNQELNPSNQFKTEYYSLGMKQKNINPFNMFTGKNRPSARPDNNQGNDSLIPSKESELKDESLDNLTSKLMTKIENHLVCPQCLNSLPSQAYFCSRCGLKVQKKELKIPEVFDESN